MNAVFWNVTPSGSEVSEERIASIIKVTRIDELVLVNLMMEAIIPPKRRFLHGVSSQKTVFL
jgi:hypothetical protein